MFNEIVTSIKAQLYERAASPLLGSFLLSWSIWNYKFVMLVFSNVQVLEKYRITSEVLYVSQEQTILMNIVFPSITALAYIFVYPYPAKYVFQFSRNRQKEISNIKKQIEAETLLTAEEARAIRRELYVLEAELEKELNRKNNEIESLKKELAGLRITVIDNVNDSNENAKVSISTDDPSDEEIEVLRIVGKAKDEVLEAELLDSLRLNAVKGKYLLGELANREYLKSRYSQNMRDHYYELTHKGRALLVNRGYA